ncbi:MAG: hypothetical protein AAFU77_08800 [Myxococcota bacterium]
MDATPIELALTEAAENPVGDSDVVRAYAAFLLALEEDDSVPMDDSLARALDRIGEAIGFL